jgi:predicted chitinase
MSKIQEFVDGYSTKIQVRINAKTAKQNIYKEARVQAIAIAAAYSGWPNSSITTIGQLFTYIFPNEDGGQKEFPSLNIASGPNPVYFDTYQKINATITDPNLFSKLNLNYIAKIDIDKLNKSKEFGGQKWFDTFMSSALSKMSSTNIKMSDFKTPSTLEDSFDDLIENFKKNFGEIAETFYTTIQVLYDAFIEAGENYNQPQSGTQSVTQSVVNPSSTQVGDYKIRVKDPKSDNDRKIEGSISFVSNGPDITTKAVLNNLPNPFTNPITTTLVQNNTGSLDYIGNPVPGSSDKNKLADTVILTFKDMFSVKYGITTDFKYESVNATPTQSSPTQSVHSSTTSSKTGATSSNFDATGIKVTLTKKSGPGELIGVTDKIITNGFIDFDGIQFDTPGDYVITISTNSELVETKDISVSVTADEVIAQEKSRGEEQTPIEGTRPIIAQIDKPTIVLKPIEFDANEDAHNNEVVVGLGFTPFVWYNSYQISVRDIKSLRLYYDGVTPKAVLNFVDSVGFMKKEGMPLDDTKFEIFFNSGTKNLKSIHMKFKVINFQENKGHSYTITGSIELKDFYKINYKSYKGTSFESLRKVSTELQLGFNSNITNTVDSMNWINHGIVFKDFLAGIINHSYISDTSYVLGYIDFYYCFNYVDIEKEWLRDISNDVGLSSTGVNNLGDDSQKDKIEKLVLTTDKGSNMSPFYIKKYKVTNNSTKISTTKGYFTTTKSYDSISKQFLVFDVDSQSADQNTNISLKGAPGDGKAMEENFRTKYSGKMDTQNVHKNYYYSETQNQVNLDNMVRISVDLEMGNPNFNLYKFQKVQIIFSNEKNTPSNSDQTQARLSGEWMIIDIAYSWTGGHLTQEVKCVRKELSKTPEEIKDNTNNSAAKPEVNTQNNENPTPGTQSTPQNVTLSPNSIYKVGEVYNVESKDGKKYTLKITSISTNGNEVNAITQSGPEIIPGVIISTATSSTTEPREYTFDVQIKDTFYNSEIGYLTITGKLDNTFVYGDEQDTIDPEYVEDTFAGSEEDQLLLSSIEQLYPAEELAKLPPEEVKIIKENAKKANKLGKPLKSPPTDLLTAMRKYGIVDKLERAHFLAQCGHESGNYVYKEELASGRAYEGRSDLGNTQAGDGSKYKGRGYIQVTGRANYTTYSKYLVSKGLDNVLNNPDLVATKYAADAACYWWKFLSRDITSIAKRGASTSVVESVTKRVNGGHNGLADRQQRFDKYWGEIQQDESRYA